MIDSEKAHSQLGVGLLAGTGGSPKRGWMAAFGVVLLAAALIRFIGLGEPPRTYFDEVYYAEDGIAVAEQGVEERQPSHPPLGPALIAVGVAVGGSEPWAWRLLPALAGLGVVLLTGLAGFRLGLPPWAAVGASLLVALDGLSLTMSRIAMLDVFVAFFVILGFWLLIDALNRSPGSPGWFPRVAAAGAGFGLATAVKWSGLLALGAALLLVGWRTVCWWRDRRPGFPEVAATGGRLAVALAVVPAAAYVLSYAGWFINYEDSAAAADRCPQGGCAVSLLDRTAVWWEVQVELVDYHRRLPATHPYRSSPATWPVLARPVLYFFEDCPAETESECAVEPGEKAKILGLGNPVVWWAAIPAALAVAASALLRRRVWAVALVAFLAIQYLPWFLAGKDGYLFYMTPVVPFLALSIAGATRMLGRRGTWALATVAVAAIAAFIYFFPIWYGIPLPIEAADSRMWFDSWW